MAFTRAPRTQALPRKKATHYVTNKELLFEVIASKNVMRSSNSKRSPSECMSPRLVEMLMLMVDRYAERANWSKYSYVEELKGQAILSLCSNWHKFDENRVSLNPPNPFSFYTSVIQNAFKYQIGKEKKPQKVRDAILVDRGMAPSYGSQIDSSMAMGTSSGHGYDD